MAQPTKLLLEFPKGIDPETVAEIRREIAATDGVKQSGSSATRSLDVAALATWVTLAGAAIPVIGQLRALFARKKVKGVKLRLASGVVIEIDEISTDDLKKLLGE